MSAVHGGMTPRLLYICSGVQNNITSMAVVVHGISDMSVICMKERERERESDYED